MQNDIQKKVEDNEVLQKELDHFGKEMVPGLLQLVQELTERVQQLESLEDSEDEEEDNDLQKSIQLIQEQKAQN